MTKAQTALLAQAAKNAHGLVSVTISVSRSRSAGFRASTAAQKLVDCGALRFVTSEKSQEGRGFGRRYVTAVYALTEAGRATLSA